jgi:hypothetical protein
MMETLICRILMVSGVFAGVLLAGGSSGALVPAILAVVCAALLRRVAPALPWRFSRSRCRSTPLAGWR